MIDDEVLAYFLARIDETKGQYRKSKEHFWYVAGKHRPTRAPYSDKTEEVTKAITLENSALGAYLSATMQLNKYLLYSNIPEDVRAKLKKPAVAAAGSGAVSQ